MPFHTIRRGQGLQLCSPLPILLGRSARVPARCWSTRWFSLVGRARVVQQLAAARSEISAVSRAACHTSFKSRSGGAALGPAGAAHMLGSNSRRASVAATVEIVLDTQGMSIFAEHQSTRAQARWAIGAEINGAMRAGGRQWSMPRADTLASKGMRGLASLSPPQIAFRFGTTGASRGRLAEACVCVWCGTSCRTTSAKCPPVHQGQIDSGGLALMPDLNPPVTPLEHKPQARNVGSPGPCRVPQCK